MTNTAIDEPRCTCGHLLSYHEHGASLKPTFECDYGHWCQCPNFEEDFTEPLFDIEVPT